MAVFQVDQTLGQSSLGKIPELAKEAIESNYSIENALTKWQNDREAAHLLQAIALLQQMVQTQLSAMMTLTQEGYALQAALREVTSHGPGSVTEAMDTLRTRTNTAANALKADAAAPPSMALDMLTLLHTQTRLFDRFQDLSEIAHNARMESLRP
jgi:predicted RNA-binding Zn ribbon-like protein